METVIQQLIHVPVEMGGQVKDVKSQTAKVYPIALDVATVMLLLIHQFVPTAHKDGWAQVVVILVYVVNRCQWTAVIVFATPVGSVLAAIVNVQAMVLLSIINANVILAGGAHSVKFVVVQGLEVTAAVMVNVTVQRKYVYAIMAGLGVVAKYLIVLVSQIVPVKVTFASYGNS